jgi:hypothetical protein
LSTNFTIEFFIKWSTQTSGSEILFSSGPGGWGLQDNPLLIALETQYCNLLGVETPTVDEWHHYAFCRESVSGILKLNAYRDGNLILSQNIVSDSFLQTLSSDPSSSSMGWSMHATISNFRVVPDVALYTGNSYTVPTADFI